MTATAVLRSEWIKVRSLRGSLGSLLAVFAATVAITVLVFATAGRAEADSGEDPLFGAFYALNFGQLAGQAFLGRDALGLGAPGALRACLGGGVYLALMALLAAGLTAVLRSAVAVLSILVPFLLIVSFVVGDLAATAADLLPDRAGQQVLRQHPVGSLGPWTGLTVTALWAALALLAGWWTVRRRDA